MATINSISNGDTGLVSRTKINDNDSAINAELLTKEPTITAGTTSQYYRGDKTFQTLDKSAVGLSNVENIKHNYAGSTDPGSNDDNTQGYSEGSTWVNLPQNTYFVAVEMGTGEAIWKNTTPYLGLEYIPNSSDGKVSSSAGTDATIPIVTPSGGTNIAGLMSPADKTKIDAVSGTNTGDQTITLTGDISGSGTGSFSATIQDNSVTSSKLADMPANTVKANSTSSTGNPSDLSITSSTILGRTSSSDLKALTVSEVKTELGAGSANGLAELDGAGKVPTSQLPDSVLGGVSYQGSWNASTNSPALTSSTGTKGFYYVVSVAGSTNLDGVTDWLVGDWVVFNGSTWEKIDNTDSISSVFGRTGAISSANGDYTASQITNSPSGAVASTTVQAAINELDSEKQPLDATLTGLAGVSTSADQLIYSTGSDTFAMSGLTSYARSILDDADATTARGTLGLGTIATQDANSVAITGGTIAGLTSLLVGTSTTRGLLTLESNANSIQNLLSLRNFFGTANGTGQEIAFIGYRDTNENHRLARILVENVQGFGDIVHGGKFSIWTNPGQSPYGQDGFKRFTVDSVGNIQVGETEQFGSGVGVIGLSDASTIPTTNPTGGGILYSNSGALTWRNPSGSVFDLTNVGSMAAQNANSVAITGGTITGVTDLSTTRLFTTSNTSGTNTNDIWQSEALRISNDNQDEGTLSSVIFSTLATDGGTPNVQRSVAGIAAKTYNRTSTLTLTSDLLFNTMVSGTLTNKMTIKGNGFVGIGTESPSAFVEIKAQETTAFPHLKITGPASASAFGAFFEIDASPGSGGRNYRMFSTAASAGEGTGKLIFQDVASGSNRVVIDSTGNIGFNTLDQFGSGQGVIGLTNATTIPTTNPTGGGVLYSNAGALTWRDPAGSVFDLTTSPPITSAQSIGTTGGQFVNLNNSTWTTCTLLSIVLPAAGTYLITYTCNLNVLATADDQIATLRLFNETGSVGIANSEIMGYRAFGNGRVHVNVTNTFIYTAAGAETLRIQGIANIASLGVVFESSAAGRTIMNYIRLS